MPQDTLILHWNTPSHFPAGRSVDWYWALGLLAIFGVVASILFGNIIFATIIALAAVCIGILAARDPREYDIEITEDGVIIDHDLHPYRSLKSFFVMEHPDTGPRLLLTTEGILHPHLIIPIAPPADGTAVRSLLLKRLPEKESHSPGTLLIELLGL